MGEERRLQRRQPAVAAQGPRRSSTARPATWPTGTRQAQTGSPSSSTVQAPQSPASQPTLVPVRPRSSRSTCGQPRDRRAVPRRRPAPFRVKRARRFMRAQPLAAARRSSGERRRRGDRRRCRARRRSARAAQMRGLDPLGERGCRRRAVSAASSAGQPLRRPREQAPTATRAAATRPSATSTAPPPWRSRSRDSAARRA